MVKMNTKLKKIAEDIAQKTGISIDIYDIFGGRITGGGGRPDYAYKNFRLSDFSQGIREDVDGKRTYFLINAPGAAYIGVIEGADEVSRNYAYMTSALIENTLVHSDDSLSRTDTLKALLSGSCTRAQIDKFAAKYALPSGTLGVLAIRCDKEHSGEVFSLLLQFSGNDGSVPVLMDDGNIAYLNFDADGGEYQSALDFAEHLCASIADEAGVRADVGVGSICRTLYEVPGSYSQAVSALKMGASSASKNRVHSYKEYIMVKMIEDIPKPTLAQHLDVLLDPSAREILDDPEMLFTAEEFLSNSLNISETSRHLYMHRNTLMYRLDKIERYMGLNIRRFSDAVTFRIILLLHRHLNGK